MFLVTSALVDYYGNNFNSLNWRIILFSHKFNPNHKLCCFLRHDVLISLIPCATRTKIPAPR